MLESDSNSSKERTEYNRVLHLTLVARWDYIQQGTGKSLKWPYLINYTVILVLEDSHNS